MGDSGNFGISLITSEYKVSTSDTDIFYLNFNVIKYVCDFAFSLLNMIKTNILVK